MDGLTSSIFALTLDGEERHRILRPPVGSTPSRKFNIFTCFPRLPTEIRLQIWRACLSDPRLIELERSTITDEILLPLRNNADHHTVQVCPKSRRAPSILHVSRESRAEAEKVLLRVYLMHWTTTPREPIWVNPRTDIIYFGPKTCISTVVRFGEMLEAQNCWIPRVALSMRHHRELTCCDWDNRTAPAISTFAINGGCTAMEALHGIDPGVFADGNTSFPGYQSLKEIYWVLDSDLWPVAPGGVGENTFLRRFVQAGVGWDELSVDKSSVESQIMEIDQHGSPCPKGNCGPPKWRGAKRPNIYFAHIADAGIQIAGQVHDSFMTMGWHEDIIRPLLNRAAELGVTLEVGSMGSEYNPSEIGVSGGKEAVWRFKWNLF